MSPNPTHLTPETHAALLAESQRRREALRQRRDLRERFAGWEWSEQQIHERSILECRMRAGKLRQPPSIFGEL